MMGIAMWLGTLWGRCALGAGIVVALVGVRAWDVAHQRSLGEARAVTKIEKVTDNAISIGKAAAARSRAAPAAGGGRVQRGADRDPTTRDD